VSISSNGSSTVAYLQIVRSPDIYMSRLEGFNLMRVSSSCRARVFIGVFYGQIPIRFILHSAFPTVFLFHVHLSQAGSCVYLDGMYSQIFLPLDSSCSSIHRTLSFGQFFLESCRQIGHNGLC